MPLTQTALDLMRSALAVAVVEDHVDTVPPPARPMNDAEIADWFIATREMVGIMPRTNERHR